MIPFRPIAAALLLSALPVVTPASAQAPAGAVTLLPSGIQASSDGVSLRVDALGDDILRVRVARDGHWPEDASWAVPASVRRQSAAVRQTADGFATAAVAVHVDPRTLQLTVTDLQGHTIVADASGALRFDGSRFALRKALPLGEHIYGMGDKTGSFDRRVDESPDGRSLAARIFVSGANAASMRALNWAEALGLPDTCAVNFAFDETEAAEMRRKWRAAEARVPLEVLAAPYRDIGDPLLAYLRELTADGSDVLAVLPELILRGWARLLHNQRALYVKRLLLVEPHVILASVPYHLIR